MDKTAQYIAAEEGCRLKAYKDSLGIWTIGYGHNLEAHGYSPEEASKVTWSQAKADNTLLDDIQSVAANLWPWALKLDDVRRSVVIGMMFQLGYLGLSKFRRTLNAIKNGHYEDAGQYMAESVWAKQCPARASRAIRMMVSGQWPKSVNGVQIA